MIYLFLAPDEFLLAQRLGTLKQAMGDPELADMNLIELDGTRTTGPELLNHAGTMPFLSERRLVIVRGYLGQLESRQGTAKNPNKTAQTEATRLLDGLAELPDTSDLIFIEEKLDKRRAIWKEFERLGKSGLVKFETLVTPEPRQLSGWIARTAKQKDIPIDGRAVQLLATYVGPDLRRLDNELEKLRAYADGRPITAEDVQMLVSDASEALIWDLTDGMSQRDGRKAMRALHELRRGDANPFYLLTMITRQYRIMIKVKDAMMTAPGSEYDIASRIGERPFPVKKAMAQSRSYGIIELETVMDRLLTADFAMKTGADADTELDVLVAELTANESI